MHYLKPPKRFPVPENMQNEETATWINWIHLETQSLIDDLNEELRLQNEEDDPFTQNIVYAPTNPVQETREVPNGQESVERKKFCTEIPPQSHKEHMEEKLASPLPLEKTNNQL